MQGDDEGERPTKFSIVTPVTIQLHPSISTNDRSPGMPTTFPTGYGRMLTPEVKMRKQKAGGDTPTGHEFFLGRLTTSSWEPAAAGPPGTGP